MTAGFLSLGAVTGTSIMDDQWSGFDYPNNAQVVALLGNGTSTYNAVLQQSALTARQGQLRCILETADSLTIRGYYESREAVTFTDWDGTATDCRVLDFARDIKFAGVWDCTITLIESDAAVAPVGVGVPVAGLATTLAADPAIGATNLRVASVTTVAAGQFVRAGAAGVTATALNSEVVRVLTVGTTGSGGTGLGIESDTGGGMVLDRANADEVKTVTGTYLAAPAAIGAKNLKVDVVADLSIGKIVRVGYLGHYETRTLTAVGTAGAGGTGVTFAIPLTRDHSLDEWVVVVG
jgi:hypothetical protein